MNGSPEGIVKLLYFSIPFILHENYKRIKAKSTNG